MEYYFWFSDKQKETCEVMNFRKPKVYRPMCCRIDGKILEYTVCDDTEDHHCDWDDLVYLGKGIIWGFQRKIK